MKIRIEVSEVLHDHVHIGIFARLQILLAKLPSKWEEWSTEHKHFSPTIWLRGHTCACDITASSRWSADRHERLWSSLIKRNYGAPVPSFCPASVVSDTARITADITVTNVAAKRPLGWPAFYLTSGNYMPRVTAQSRTLHFVFMCFVWFSL
jgi:hypothetical protein